MAEAAQKVEETPTEINFEDAFARLAELEGDTAPAATGDEPAKEPEKAPETPETPETGTSGDEPAPETAEKPAEAPAEPAKAPAEAADDTDTILQRLAKLVKEEPAPQRPAQTQEQPQPQAPYSPEEQEFLTNYEKDWPDVAKAESLRRRAEYQQLMGYVFSEVAKELRPLMETVQVLAQRTHLSDLTTQVQDYDQVRENVIGWVEQQPTYLQVAYKHVIENGTVEEVADLVNRYKRETGAAQQQAAPASAPVKKETELPSATKQAAAALAPVSSKRSAVAQSTDPEDFESAFAAFASKM